MRKSIALLLAVAAGLWPLSGSAMDFLERPPLAYCAQAVSNGTLLQRALEERSLSAGQDPPGSDCGQLSFHALDTKLKSLVGSYLDDTQPPGADIRHSVTGLWARLGIGDLTNQFTRQPENANTPWQMQGTDFVERCKVAYALCWTSVPREYSNLGGRFGMSAGFFSLEDVKLAAEWDFYFCWSDQAGYGPHESVQMDLHEMLPGMYSYAIILDIAWGDVILRASQLSTHRGCEVNIYTNTNIKVMTMGGVSGNPITDYTKNYPCPGPWDAPPGQPGAYVPPPAPPYPAYGPDPVPPNDSKTYRWVDATLGEVKWSFLYCTNSP